MHSGVPITARMTSPRGRSLRFAFVPRVLRVCPRRHLRRGSTSQNNKTGCGEPQTSTSQKRQTVVQVAFDASSPYQTFWCLMYSSGITWLWPWLKHDERLWFTLSLSHCRFSGKRRDAVCNWLFFWRESSIESILNYTTYLTSSMFNSISSLLVFVFPELALQGRQ